MLNTLRINSIKAAGLKAALAAVLLAGSAAASAVTVNLCATAGTTAATPVGVPVWGYATGACPAAVGAPGGPVIYAAVGESVTVNLSNSLPEATGLVFQGQAMVPDATGAAASGGTRSYTFTATKAGTFLYQAAPLTNAEHQVAKGLYGALVVRAPDVTRTDTASTLNGSVIVSDTAVVATDAGSRVSGAGIPLGATVATVVPGTSFTLSVAATADGTGVPIVLSKGSAYGATFDDEAVLVLSEIDPALNNHATPLTFDMRNFAPKYFLINGKAHPDTDVITSVAGRKLLLRYVNAGSKHHSMGTLGLRQNFIAKDGSALPTANVGVTAETLASGQTGDALITVPAAGRFAMYDASLSLHNSNAPGIGGMLTFVNAGASAAVTGPTTSGAAISPSPTTGAAGASLSASVTTTDAGGVTAVEYFIDTKGADGAGVTVGTVLTGTAPNYTGTITATTLGGLSSGNHTFYVHGQDANGWGGYSFAVLNLDKTGPTTSAVALSPNPSSGAVPVTLTASASDVATGGSNVTSATYSVDGGAAVGMTLAGSAAPVRSLSAVIPSGLAVGNHVIAIQSTDALGNLGAVANITLTVASAGPATSLVAATPNPNNGAYTISSNQPVMRVTATITGSSLSNVINAAEGFIDSTPAINTRGFPFVPVDGVWNSSVEKVSVDLPIANIAVLTAGNHTINVRGKDATGSWGSFGSVTLVIDKTAPTLTSGSVSPSAIPFGTASVTLTFGATDNVGGVGLAGVQYWFDNATPPASPATAAGNGTASISTSTLPGGDHTLYFRARDAANNVSSAVRNVSLTVVQAVANGYNTFIQNNTAGNNRVQTITVGGTGVLGNDLPTGGTRAATPANPAVTRISGAGSAVMTVALATNGSITYTLTVPNSVTGNANIRAAKRGTYRFNYTFTRNGVASVGTVTITVN